MKIAVLSDWENAGGANIAAVRMTEGFRDAGHDVVRIYQQANVKDRGFQTHLVPSAWATHLQPFAKRLSAKLTSRANRQREHEKMSEAGLADILRAVRPDVINVHNLHIGRWSPAMIRVCASFAPVVCKLCDTWTFTGRCYNPGPCEKFLTRCDSTCPTADEYPALNPRLIPAAFELRRQILSECTNVAAVAPSAWVGRLASAGLWAPRPVFQIANGIPLDRYAPMNRSAARRALGVPDDRPVLLCAASLLSERKKGLPLLVEALSLKIGAPIRLLLIGEIGRLDPIEDVEVQSLGFIKDDERRALAYNCADIYVHPSLADNSPNTVIEALACGTPTVGFPIDGVPEMVVPGQTGWLATEVSAAALSAAVVGALAQVRQGGDLRDSCRQFAESRFGMAGAVQRYTSVFAEMMSGRPVAAGLRLVA